MQIGKDIFIIRNNSVVLIYLIDYVNVALLQHIVSVYFKIVNGIELYLV